jgi:hypothetical protein
MLIRLYNKTNQQMQISELSILVIENPLLDITVDDNDSVLHAKHGLEHG